MKNIAPAQHAGSAELDFRESVTTFRGIGFGLLFAAPFWILVTAGAVFALVNH
ncbi:hypothetical protein [Leifsonia sp. Leaf264]|uniref:hypothetical protein n=1 Tax=Leifsonia sp. Leaf264 TaxID=1736314 RepID=UPI000B172CB0|nr:hypothetical protein [Leifsonia sp. Leaf264]